MNFIRDAFTWLTSAEQWHGDTGIGLLIRDHLLLTALGVGIAALIAIPSGWVIGHTGRGRNIAVGISGAARAVPSFGLLILLTLVLGVLHKPEAALITFVILALPSLLAGAYSGIEAIDRAVIEASYAIGMSRWQVLWRVEVPLGLPLLVSGLRQAVLQVVATVTIAAYINLGGLGLPIITGLALRRYDMVLGGALLVTVLALALDLFLAGVQRVLSPSHLHTERMRSMTDTESDTHQAGTGVPRSEVTAAGASPPSS